MKRLALFAAVLAFVLAGCGQQPVVWQYRLDPCPGSSVAASSIACDGKALYVGATATGRDNRPSALVTKLTLAGRQIWSRLYKDAPQSACADVACDAAGACYAVGRVKPTDRTACLVVKYGYEGGVAWQKGLELGETTYGLGVTVAGPGRIAVCGVAGTDANSDLMIALLDARDGRIVWARNYDLGRADLARRIASDPKGNLAVVGQRGDSGAADIVVLKLNPNGDTLWTRTYDSGGEDAAGDVALDEFGNVLVTGTAVVGDSSRCVILEYGPDGGVIRKSAYGQQAQAQGSGIFVTATSDIFVCGTLLGAAGAAGRKSEVLAFQYQPSAQSVWERHHGPDQVSAAGADIVVPDNVCVAANTGTGSAGAWVYCFSRPTAPRR
jgi:hypothetical protein